MKNLLSKASSLSRPSILATSIAALILAASPAANALTAVWTGSGADTNWQTGSNWSGGAGTAGAAAAADILNFGGNVQNSTNNNFTAGTTFNGINFTNDGLATNTNAFTLAGNSILPGGNITTTVIGTGGTAITDTISLGMQLTANRTVTTGTGHNLIISGAITQNSATRQLIKSGSGELTLTNASNSYLGKTSINAGTLTIDVAGGIANAGVNSALGAGTAGTNSSISFGGATLNVKSGAASTDRQIDIFNSSGGGTINNNTANGSGTLVFTNAAFNIVGATSTGSNRGITLGGANTDANAIQGVIADNTGTVPVVSVTKADAGKWILSGANTYTGSTTVSAGTLAGIGASAFGNTSGISISGTGTLSLLGDSSTSFVKPTGGAAIAVSTSAIGATINVDRATVGGTGAKTMTLGALTTSSTSATWTLGLTGANNTSLSIGAVTGPASTSTSSPTVTFTNGITGGGKLTLASYTAANTGVGGNETVRFDGGINEITGAITPSAQLLSLRIAGGASLTLNAASTYTNGTTNSSGDLIIKNNTALGSGGVILGVSGTTGSSDVVRLLIGTAGVNAANTIDMGGSTGTAGAAFSIGSTVDGNTTFSGAINVQKNSSITQVATTGANALSITGGISSAAARTITFAGPGAINVGTNGMADGAGALSVSVTGGTTTLTATNAYSGTTGVSAGTLSLTGSLTGGGAISTSGTGILNESAVGVISGASSVTQGSSGTSVLSGANTYSGGTTLSAGQLNINNAGSGGTSSAIGTGALTIAAGTTIDNTTNGAITLSTSNAVNLNGDFTYGGTRDLNLGTGAVALAATSNATPRIITLGGSGRTLTFGGTVSLSTNTGPRTFQVDGAGNTLVLGSLVLNADLTGSRISTFSGSGNITVNGTVTPGGNTANGLTYAGTGTLTLGGATSFTGNTAVSSGTLLVNSTSASTSVIASGSGTLGGTGTINGSVAVQTGGKITGGTDTNVGQLATGALTLSTSTSILSLQVSAVNTVAANGKGTTHDNLNVTGALTYGSGTLIVTDLGGAFDLSGQAGVYDLLDATSFSGNLAAVTVDSITLSRSGTLWSSSIFTFEQTTGILTVTAVPEPSTYIGGGLILGLAAWSQRRRFTFSTAQSSDGLVS